MFRKFISFLLPLMLIFSFGATTTVLAEPFTAVGAMQVLNLPECNLSIKYNSEKMFISPVTIDGITSYFIASQKDPYVFLRAGCRPAILGGQSTPARVPFWTGTRPDYTKIKIETFGIKKSGNEDGSGALYYVIENKENPIKSITLLYNYKTSDFGSWLDVYSNGVFASQAGITSSDLEIRYINDPVYATDVVQAATNIQSSPTNDTNTTPTNVITTQNELVTPKPSVAKPEEKIADKVASFDSKKYLSCKGNTGKYLNDKGEVIKASKVPKRSNIIKADENGTILNSPNDYIYCIKNAKPFGIINCQNNLGQSFNSKGKKLNQYTRGTIFYASPEFGNIYTSPKAAVMCTDNQYFLEKIVFQK